MICQKCRDREHVACMSADCTCGHSGSGVRSLTDAERQDVRAGRLDVNVMPRDTTNGGEPS